MNDTKNEEGTQRSEVASTPFGVWQPIETAPKDGTHFYSYFQDVEEVVCPYDITYWGKLSYGNGWITMGGESFPSHWMPLPDAPNAEAQGMDADQKD